VKSLQTTDIRRWTPSDGPGELKSENVGVSPLKVNGITKTNPIDQAAFNNHFECKNNNKN
jgi:hypothetical protein